MAVPKQRQNRSRTRRRRGGHSVLSKKQFVECKKCGKMIISHKICPNCGSYKEKEVLDVMKKVKKKA